MIRNFILALGTLPLLSAAEDMAWVNVDPARAPTLAAAATALGLAPLAAKDTARPTRVLLYQAEQQGVALTQAVVAALRRAPAPGRRAAHHPRRAARARTPTR